MSNASAPAAVLAAAVLALWLHLAVNRQYDPDEFEHLHAAWCVAHGQVPYRDFFEHHGPLPYSAQAVLCVLLPQDHRQLIWQRGVSLLAVAATLVLLGRAVSGATGRPGAPGRRRGAAAGWAAAGLLLSWRWFMEKAVENRPDVPAMLLLVAAAALTVAGGNRPRFGAGRLVAIGVLLGLAGLCTVKAGPAAVGAALAALVVSAGRGPALPLRLLLGAAGVLLPWGVAVAVFAALGGAGAFLEHVVVLPLTWPVQGTDPGNDLWRRFTDPTRWSAGQWSLGLVGLVAALGWAWRGDRRALPLALPALGQLAGLSIAKATYLQYYVLVLPHLAGLGALLLVRPFPDRGRVLAGLLALNVAASVGLMLAPDYAMQQPPQGWPEAIALTLMGAALFLLWRDRRRGPRLRTAVVVGVALGYGGAHRVAFQAAHWNTARPQRAAVAAVNELAGPDGKVLDGFSGYGCLRPHLDYYWWLNDYSEPVIQRGGGLHRIPDKLRRGEAAVVLYDKYLQDFGPVVADPLANAYRRERELFDKVPAWVPRVTLTPAPVRGGLP